MPDAAYLGQILVNGVSVGCIYGLIGIGFCVIYNASGIVNFAQGAFVMLGGMIDLCVADVARAAAGRGRAARDRAGGGDRRGHRAPGGAPDVGSQRHHVRDDPGDARGADRDRARHLILVGDQPKSIPVFTDLPPIRIAGIAISYQIIWIIGDVACC